MGHDAIHVRDVGLADASDEVIFDFARHEDRIIVSADTDFGTLLAMQSMAKPSLILFRRSNKQPDTQLKLLLDNLTTVAEALAEGAVVVFDEARIRIRRLPLV